MDLYEMNVMFYHNLPPLEAFDKAIDTLDDFFKKHPGTRYYMLLNNQLRYYTIFVDTLEYDCIKMAEHTLEVVRSLGEIKDVVYDDENDGVEFWVTHEGKTHMFLMFTYTEGVIPI